jgi:dehydrogenase/reductase SDR family protein 13
MAMRGEPEHESHRDLAVQDRTFLVTGASSGIGRALVEALAARGGRVVLAARSPERTLPVLNAIRSRHPQVDVRFLQIDLADFRSVRRAAAEYLAGGGGLDVLVNNAGVAGTFGLSPDGFDLTYATNHLGPFLLTNLLLGKLRESPAARMVNVSSMAHFNVKKIDWAVLERRSTPTRSGFAAYSVTKLMNVLHAKELARRLAGTAVTTYALHPGAVASNIWRAVPAPLQWLLKLFLISNEKGAQTPLYCATAPELGGISGRYYNRCREARASPIADDPVIARELWMRSEAAVAPP